jgi:hypothetical protein
MYLEDSNGRIHQSPSSELIHDTLDQIGGSLDHCILSLSDDSFVQAAGQPGRLLVQYGESDALFESTRADFDVATVARIFTDAMAGNDGWKTEFEFQPVDGAPGASGTPGNPSSAGRDTPQSGGSLKDQILGSVRQQAGREISNGVGRIARKALRRFLGGR